MVEFIGIVVAACAAWFLWRAIVARLLPRMMRRGAAYAQEHGAVPLEFSADLLKSPSEVKVARAWMAKGDSDFGALDGYKQYGKVIIRLYQDRRANIEHVKAHMEKTAFGPQRNRFLHISACPISALYVITLTSILSPVMPTADEMKEVYDHCFRDADDAFSREKAWADAMNSQSTQDDMEGMGEIAGRETQSANYEFFCKLRQRQTADAANGINETALALTDPRWYLKI